MMLIESEELKPHPKFNHLLINKNGDIFSAKTGKKRKYNRRKDRYFQISIKRSSFLCHRLVAQTWIENPDDKPCINHKNGNRDDNRIENLEWVTQRENIIHARDKLGVKFSKLAFDNGNSRFLECFDPILINLYKIGLTQKEMAFVFDLALPTIKFHLDRLIKHDK